VTQAAIKAPVYWDKSSVRLMGDATGRTYPRGAEQSSSNATMGGICQLTDEGRATNDGNDRAESDDQSSDKEHGIMLRCSL
jgi:hypothetical protein